MPSARNCNRSSKIEDFRKTSAEANQALGHIDAMVGENRADVRQAVVELRRSLTNMTGATARLDQTRDDAKACPTSHYSQELRGGCLVRGAGNDNRNPLSRCMIVNDVFAGP
jgi:hypothetical protein